MFRIKIGSRTINAAFAGFLILLLYYWCDRTILSYIKGIIDSSQIVLGLYNVLLVVLIIISWLFVLNTIVNSIRLFDIIFCVFVIAFYIHSVHDSRTSMYALENLANFFLLVFPCYFIGRIFPNKDEDEVKKVFDILYSVSFWGVLLAVVYTFYVIMTGRNWSGADNMAHAYSILFSLLYIIWYKGEKLKKGNFILVIIGFGYLVAMGTRGALLASLIWWFICFLIQKENSRTKKILVGIVILVLVAFIFSSFMQSFASSLYSLFSRLGLNIRIFEYVLNHNIGDANGRELIYSNLTRYINEVKGGISGFYYDRVATNGVYAHNIVIELLVDFGTILGSAIVLLIAGISTVGVVKQKKHYYKEFIIMFVVGIFTKLMLSSSFLNEAFFFFTIGLLVNSISTRVSENEY